MSGLLADCGTLGAYIIDATGPLVSRWDAFFVVGTADTKGEELAYLRAAVTEAGRAAIVVDFGIDPLRCDVRPGTSGDTFPEFSEDRNLFIGLVDDLHAPGRFRNEIIQGQDRQHGIERSGDGGAIKTNDRHTQR